MTTVEDLDRIYHELRAIILRLETERDAANLRTERYKELAESTAALRQLRYTASEDPGRPWKPNTDRAQIASLCDGGKV